MWFVDKLGPPEPRASPPPAHAPNANPSASGHAPQRDPPASPAAPQATQAAPAPPEPEKKKKKGWF